MKKRLSIVIAIIAIGGLIFVGESWSQQGAIVAPTTKSPPPTEDFVPPSDFRRRGKIAGPESVKTAWKIQQLMNQLREDEEKKASNVSQSGTSSTSVTTSAPETPREAQKKVELTKQLEAAVAEGFDEDMKVREGELSKLEERLNKLRAQLDRRRKAKSEIIQLEVKVLVNEAAGLGFSGGPSQGLRRGFMGVSKSFRRSLDDSELAEPQRVAPRAIPSFGEERPFYREERR
jgi:hypothetical protein